MRVHGYYPSPGSLLWLLVSIGAFLAMSGYGVFLAWRGLARWRWVIASRGWWASPQRRS